MSDDQPEEEPEAFDLDEIDDLTEDEAAMLGLDELS